MRAEAASIIDTGSPERLTHAIRNGLAEIEKDAPGVLDYDDVPLRGALERFVYQEAVLDPTRLVMLAKATGNRDAFAEWLPKQMTAAASPDLWAYPKAWVRLIFRGLMNPAGRHDQRNATPGPEFVFHVLRPRFVNFFAPIIERLGRDRCALLYEPGYGVEETAARYGLSACERTPARLLVRALRRPPTAIFPIYALAVVALLNALGTLRRYRPRVVVFAEAASFPEEIVARAARALGIATVRLQYGRAGLLSPGYYEMPYDKMLMWGDGFVDRIKALSPDSCYFVTGSPLLDSVSRAEGSQSLDALAGTGVLMTVITQPECNSISREDYRALVRVVDRVLNTNRDLKVLVRLHPADAATDFQQLAAGCADRLRVTTAEEYPLEAVLAGSTLVLGLYSTVLSEAVAYGVLPVIIRLGDRHRIFPSPEDTGAAALATNCDEAVTTICRLVEDPVARQRYQPAMRAFARKYFGPMDGGALERITYQIENAVHR